MGAKKYALKRFFFAGPQYEVGIIILVLCERYFYE